MRGKEGMGVLTTRSSRNFIDAGRTWQRQERKFSLQPIHAYATTMVRLYHVGEDRTSLLTGSAGTYHVQSRY